MSSTARNVAIVLLLAAAVAFLPGGGTTSSVLYQAFGIIFLAGLVFFAYRMYRENRVALYGLGDRNRLILYASAGAVLLAISGTSKLLRSGPGTLLWIVMICGAVGGVLYVIAGVRRYD